MSGDVVYWTSSAVLSVLFRDEHSEAALSTVHSDGVHLLSSPAWAEVHAVVARIERERALASVLVDAAREVLDTGPWRHLNVVPNRAVVRRVAQKWPLSGADLWQLAAAKTLQAQLADLAFLSFDDNLIAAAQEERLAIARPPTS